MIYVVIVNYCAQALVVRCLESLIALGREDLKYIVVDNSPDDDTNLIAQKIPDAEIIRPGSNLGFAGGCNIGIRKALDDEAAYVLLLNPDTYVEQDFLEPLLKTASEFPEAGILAPTIFNDDVERSIWFGGSRINWWRGGAAHRRSRLPESKDECIEIPFATGCAMLVRIAAMRAAGPMSEDYFLYFEDNDYCQRILREGWSIRYVPRAEVVHAASSTTGFQSEPYVYFFSRNRILFMRRWAKWYHFLVFMTYNTTVKIAGAVIVFGFLRRAPHLAFAFLGGYWDGIRGVTGPRLDSKSSASPQPVAGERNDKQDSRH